MRLQNHKAGYYECINTFFTLVLVLLCSGCNIYNNTLSFSDSDNRVLSFPMTHDQLLRFYMQRPYTYASYLRPEYQAKAIAFTEQEANITIKGRATDYGGNNIPLDVYYFEVDSFKLDGYTYKLVMYHNGDSNGARMLSIQLNSYDKKGDIVDALLLERRYSYLHFSTFSKFTINKNIVDIDNYIFDTFERHSNGDIVRPIKNPVASQRTKEQYKINKGKFKLISNKEFN